MSIPVLLKVEDGDGCVAIMDYQLPDDKLTDGATFPLAHPDNPELSITLQVGSFEKVEQDMVVYVANDKGEPVDYETALNYGFNDDTPDR